MNIIEKYMAAKKQLERKAEEQFQVSYKKKKFEMSEKKGKEKKKMQDGTGLEEILDALALQSVTADIQREIGNRLLKVRENQGLTQKQIAEAYSQFQPITDTCLSKWESGTNPVSLLFLLWLSQKYGVDLHWLITGEERKSPGELLEDARTMAKTLSGLLEKI